MINNTKQCPFCGEEIQSNCKEMQALRRMVGRLSFQYKKIKPLQKCPFKGFK